MAEIKDLLPNNYTQKIRFGISRRLAIPGCKLTRSEAGALAVHEILDNRQRGLGKKSYEVRRELRTRAWAAKRMERVEENPHYQSAREKLGFTARQ